MENNRITNTIKDTLTIVTTALPLCLSMAACCPINNYTGLIAAAFSALFVKINSDRQIMPVIISFLCFSYTLSAFGIGAACFSVLLCGLILIVTAFSGFDVKSLIFNPAVTAVMQASAIVITVLQTTNYFGIGATGNTIDEMLASYTSLGFHPNWRGVLYGTIVMVIMITYPRKLKKTEKAVRATFAALAITLALNLILNPSQATSAINEIGSFQFSFGELFGQIRNFRPSLASFTSSVISAIALYVSAAYSLNLNKTAKSSDYLVSGIANVISSFFGFFVPVRIRKKSEFGLPNIMAAVIITVIALTCKDLIARIPLHSCAVVLIVAAWQSMKWSYYKTAFSNVASITCLLAVLAFSLLFGITKGVVFAAIFSIVCSLTNQNAKIKQ
ncbi:MAG: SulP family inorganic anion transporter [Clostridia bacterium]|nr:SulP family inorganic anion transporter [Clostridia bacterium]